MTEAEWMECEDFDQVWMSSALEQVSHRRWRLYACACCRLIPEFMASAPDVECLILAEAEADGLWQSGVGEYPTDDWDIRWYRRDAHSIAHRAATAYRDFVWRSERSIRKSDVAWAAVQTLADRPLCELLRDVFGNPFRPATLAPAWRTSTVTSLASQMYESRDFGAMPILADALQDAGCDSDDILNHCRGDGPHVRGCWVVDLVLDKE